MFAILFWFICCWPSWKSKTTTKVRHLSQAGRARQLYATLLARAHSLTLSHIHTHKHICCFQTLLCCLGTVQSNELLYRRFCVFVCINFRCIFARAKGAWWCMCSLLCLDVCVFVILTSVSPLICRDSAVLMKAGRASCLTFTSPQYINCIRSFSAEWLTLFKKTKNQK